MTYDPHQDSHEETNALSDCGKALLVGLAIGAALILCTVGVAGLLNLCGKH